MMVHLKYIDPNTWELVTSVNGVETNRSNNPARIVTHLKHVTGYN